MVYPSLCTLSVTLMHPAKAVGQNDMPFGKDTRVVRCNVVLHRVLCPPWEGGPNAQFTVMPPVAITVTVV